VPAPAIPNGDMEGDSINVRRGLAAFPQDFSHKDDGFNRISATKTINDQQKPWDLSNKATLVGGLEHFFFFHSVGNFIIPIDEVHHFSEG
jgi:hypothetical protein